MTLSRFGSKREDIAFGVVSYAVIILLMIATLYPMWYVACASFTDPIIVSRAGGLLLFPQKITLDAYRRVIGDHEIWTGYANTFFYTILGTALNVCLTTALSYTLSKRSLKLHKPLTLFVMFTMFFNGGMIPTYLLVRQLGILNTRYAVLLPGLVGVFNFIIMRTNFESLPAELSESAELDGANDFTIFTRIALPLSGATLAVMVLFYGVNHWSSWFNEMMYLTNRRDLWPLALITREIIISSSTAAMSDGAIITQENADAVKYATIIVTTLPILLLYPFLQRYFVKGVMIGAVKG
jgi:putative aldouronate transport system permease protein